MEKHMEYAETLKMAKRIGTAVKEAGGSAYFVGGFVRDSLLGQECKDIDIEVHGILPETLERILDSIGERMEIGESFGIYNLRHYSLDIAMPRKESKTGNGHRDFRCDIDPFCGTYIAARRRDFTINAIMQDICTGEYVDHFGGRDDLRDKIIRHVDSEHFIEDPLRVLRCARFAARFGYTVAGETQILCSEMPLLYLAPERIQGELLKALVKSEKPSIFFETLNAMHQLGDWFPELEKLIGVPQNPEYHPEGDAYTHTMLVLNAASGLKTQVESDRAFMLAALLHDCGKVVSTQIKENGKVSAIGHEQTGIQSADAFMNRILIDHKTMKYVENMVSMHMRPHLLVAQKSRPKSFMKMFDESVAPEELLLLAKADRMGQLYDMECYKPDEQLLQDMLNQYRQLQEMPQVTGRDLQQAGFKPSPLYKERLGYAHKLWLAGIPYDHMLRETIAYGKKAAAK